MKDGISSWTAESMAALRYAGGFLPAPYALARDEYGAAFATGSIATSCRTIGRYPDLAAKLLGHAGPLTSMLLWMQLRTRAIDDELLAFVRGGGRQIVLLGAGFDCRTLRLAPELRQSRVFEVDHPATQARKLRVLAERQSRAQNVYVRWDFEHDSLSGLPAQLHAQGLERTAPVLTIWEGVTMYLSESAIAGSVRAVRAFSDRSRLVFNYVSAESVGGSHARGRRLFARGAGEPFRFGFRPEQLAAWFEQHDFELVVNRTVQDLAAQYFGDRLERRFPHPDRYVAVAAA
jgi:methyltransferase (TIGR00027 family)